MECRLKAGIFPEASKKKKKKRCGLLLKSCWWLCDDTVVLHANFLILHTHQMDFYNRDAQIVRLSLTFF